MIQTISGPCPSCKKEFSFPDTVQSTQVRCNQCGEQAVLCRTCKERGCACGGTFENTFDRNPGLLH